MIAAGETIPNFYRGGLKEEIVKCSPYGERSPPSAQARRRRQSQVDGGRLHHLQGPIMDNKGKA